MDRAFVSDMTITEKINEYTTSIIILVFALGWIDILWIFGIKNSIEYTWWFLIYSLVN